MNVAVASTSDAAARRLIRELIFELAPNRAPATVQNPHLINDLQYHSLALLELAFTLEDEFGIPPIDQQAAQAIATVNDVENYVISQIAVAAPNSDEGPTMNAQPG